MSPSSDILTQKYPEGDDGGGWEGGIREFAHGNMQIYKSQARKTSRGRGKGVGSSDLQVP
jgi:hypothetical protein